MTAEYIASTPAGLFQKLGRQPPDALLAVIGMHAADPRPTKIDVGVGIFRDANGNTPVLRAVKAAEARLLVDQTTKTYLGAEGDQRFTELLAKVALGTSFAADPRLTGVQTPGGTGALRLAAELIARSGTSRVWIGTPSWPNHAPIFQAAGLEVSLHPYFNARTSEVDFTRFIESLAGADAGDVLLLHGCCHNPTGATLSNEQWSNLAECVGRRGLIPLVDLAYQGLGLGLDQDAAGMRTLLSAVPESLVAYSCNKNFGLYRERVGALWVLAETPTTAQVVRETLLGLARCLWSMPPDHGAAVVRLILEDATLAAEWRLELHEMRTRIDTLRALLGASHPALASVARQHGLFALLPINAAAVEGLRERHGIYMPDSGRINIAGLSAKTIPRFAEALIPHLVKIDGA